MSHGRDASGRQPHHRPPGAHAAAGGPPPWDGRYGPYGQPPQVGPATGGNRPQPGPVPSGPQYPPTQGQPSWRGAPPPGGPPAGPPPWPGPAAAQPPGPPPAPRPGPPPGAPPGRRRTPWWRRGHTPHMLALAVVLPAALAVPWYFQRQSLLQDGAGALPAVHVPPDQPSEYAGAQWRFVSAESSDPAESSSLPVPADTVLVETVFSITPADAESSEAVRSCSFSLYDDQGRRWDTAAGFDSLTEEESEVLSAAWGCTTADSEPLPPGEEHLVSVDFLVPADATGLSPEVRLLFLSEEDAAAEGVPYIEPEVLRFAPLD
ncbi:hypothetical protein [Allonocardiopsis opalescens]|uniref:Uncharacterized protein n=1 Tax=Allonocardiopsis opalescens TaxID=1144618 RepID=A0A2T0Q7K1_9ACTN|nr:hypothetical protein [Allonocardiopsis opalescens]PRX99774.1 hypothetical protein CLV72_103380 [Allonocardiopsis opalescens]